MDRSTDESTNSRWSALIVIVLNVYADESEVSVNEQCQQDLVV